MFLSVKLAVVLCLCSVVKIRNAKIIKSSDYKKRKTIKMRKIKDFAWDNELIKIVADYKEKEGYWL